MLADLDPLLTAVFCTADDLLPERARNARRRLTDAEVVTLCVVQVRPRRRRRPGRTEPGGQAGETRRPAAAVVAGGEENTAEWLAQQDDLARLSRNTIHRTIAGSTHASLIEDEPDAAESSRAIRDVVGAVRLRGRAP